MTNSERFRRLHAALLYCQGRDNYGTKTVAAAREALKVFADQSPEDEATYAVAVDALNRTGR
jgi:hypothetical protein